MGERYHMPLRDSLVAVAVAAVREGLVWVTVSTSWLASTQPLGTPQLHWVSICRLFWPPLPSMAAEVTMRKKPSSPQGVPVEWGCR